jgi:hypothetical protein
MYYSFFGQLARGAGADVSGLPNRYVVWIKGVLFLIGIVAAIRSGQTLLRERAA